MGVMERRHFELVLVRKPDDRREIDSLVDVNIDFYSTTEYVDESFVFEVGRHLIWQPSPLARSHLGAVLVLFDFELLGFVVAE